MFCMHVVSKLTSATLAAQVCARSCRSECMEETMGFNFAAGMLWLSVCCAARDVATRDSLAKSAVCSADATDTKSLPAHATSSYEVQTE